MNMIDSNKLERDAGGKPVPTFPHPALGPAFAKEPEASAMTPFACPAGSKTMARLELLFGTAGLDAAQWHLFLEEEVTPRFPNGLTVLEAYGQWRNGEGIIIKEPSRMLVIWHEIDAQADAKIEAIRSAYKKQFGQTSVMRVDGSSCVSF
jgi:hypothetical protein